MKWLRRRAAFPVWCSQSLMYSQYGPLKNMNTLLIILTVREATVIYNNNMVGQDHCRLPGVLHINVGFLREIFRFWWVRKLCSVFAWCVWVCVMLCLISPCVTVPVLDQFAQKRQQPPGFTGSSNGTKPRVSTCMCIVYIYHFILFSNFRVIWSYCCF